MVLFRYIAPRCTLIICDCYYVFLRTVRRRKNGESSLISISIAQESVATDIHRTEKRTLWCVLPWKWQLAGNLYLFKYICKFFAAYHCAAFVVFTALSVSSSCCDIMEEGYNAEATTGSPSVQIRADAVSKRRALQHHSEEVVINFFHGIISYLFL